MTAQKLADAIRELIAEYEAASGTMVQRVTASGRHGVLEVEIEQRVLAMHLENRAHREWS